MAQTATANSRMELNTRRLAVAVAAGCMTVASAFMATTTVLARGGEGLRAEANEYRTSRGVRAVVGTDLLDDIATHRARQMAAAGQMQHDLEYVGARLDRSGVCWSGFGEIIAWESGYSNYSYARTMSLWWDSPPHHEVMMDSAYNAAGGAWATADDGAHYSAMIFVTLCNVSTSSVPKLRPQVIYDPDRQMVISRGTRVGYKLSRSGNVLSRKSIRLESRREALSAGRSSLDGTAYVKVTSGVLDGYWVRESSDVFVRGIAKRATFDPERRARFAAGGHTGFQFTRDGFVRDRYRSGLQHAAKFSVSGRAIINGNAYLRVSGGRWQGYWVRDTGSVTLL